MEQLPELPALPPPDVPDASFGHLHNPLMRVLPPALRYRSTGVEGSLKVVEDFFGAKLCPKMITAAATLPEHQLTELDRALSRSCGDTHVIVSAAERPQNLEADPFRAIKAWTKPAWERDLDRQLPIHAEADPYWPRRHIVNVEEIGLHEDTLPTYPLHQCPDLPSVNALKHMTLYCQQTAVRDPLFTPFGTLYDYKRKAPNAKDIDIASPDAQRRFLANGIRQLLPLAPLVRSGAVVLLADYSSRRLFTNEADRNDPLLWDILNAVRPDLREQLDQLHAVPSPVAGGDERTWFQACRQLDRLDAEIQTVVRTFYPYDTTEKSWGRIVAFSDWIRTYSLTPFTSDPDILRHLAHNTRLAMQGESVKRLSRNIDPVHPSNLAVAYQVPELSGVSFADLARLRDASLFGEIRAATLELTKTCAASNPQNFDDYQKLVGESTQDIIGPLYRKVVKRRWLGKLASLGVTGVSSAAHMEFSGVAGKVAAAGVKRLGDEYVNRKRRVHDTAHGILRSLSNYK